MDNLIDKSYFIREIALPEQRFGDGMDGDIKRYQPEILKMLLGQTLYDDLVANTSDAKWQALITGYDYTVDYGGDTINVSWKGLQNSEKISLISDYVFCKTVSDHETTTTNVGVVVANVENSNKISATVRTSRAWNRMRELYGYSGQSKLIASAYNFLRYNGEYDFDNWIFTELEQQNIWGI